MTKFAKIAGVGSYLPEKILSNRELEKMVDTSDEWIVTRTGIKERHIAAKDETPASMAETAARRALEDAKVDPKEIELIIVATCTPEKFLPSTACLLQHRLGIGPCAAFDVSAACTGFIYAMDIASHFVRSGQYKTVLVVGSEILSRVTDWNDRNTCVLFGDGAGAAVLQASDEPGIVGGTLYADGAHQALLDLPAGIYDNPGCITMRGREVFKLAVNAMANASLELLKKHHYSPDDIDWVIPHQANSRIIEMVVNKLKLPREKVIFTVSKHANTSGASIPLAFDDAVKTGRIKRGDRVLLTAFGGGLTWGALLLHF